jgi:hypothetical protein
MNSSQLRHTCALGTISLINEWVMPFLGLISEWYRSKWKIVGGNQDSYRRIPGAYVYVSGQGAFVFVILGAGCAYVFVVLRPECLCNLFRLKYMCDFRPESLYVDYWSREPEL